MRLVVARHVALVLSAFDVMTLAHAWQGVKDFVMGQCGAVGFQRLANTWRALEGRSRGARGALEHGQCVGWRMGYPMGSPKTR